MELNESTGGMGNPIPCGPSCVDPGMCAEVGCDQPDEFAEFGDALEDSSQDTDFDGNPCFDISDEQRRWYVFESGFEMEIIRPQYVTIFDSGMHEVSDDNGRTYFVKPSFVCIVSQK